jgi:MoxR-like ATPase
VTTIQDLRRTCDRVLAEVERVIVGKRDVLELVLLGFLCDGHVLLEDVPGLAKTLMARSFAQAVGFRFARIQFTPDLMPADITGSLLLDQRSGELEFRPGPIFANLVLADEINRSPAKTQSALLEAMQERQVTSDGVTRPLEPPFLVIATENPIEYEGTYPLPEAQLDRFLLRTPVGYPSRGDAWTILKRRLDRGVDEVALGRVVDAAAVVELQGAVETVHVAESIGLYIVDIVEATRASPSVSIGSSPRGALALMKLARARAALSGRDFVTPEDVKAMAVPALAHRLVLRPELWIQRVTGDDVVREALEGVPTPAAEDLART